MILRKYSWKKWLFQSKNGKHDMYTKSKTWHISFSYHHHHPPPRNFRGVWNARPAALLAKLGIKRSRKCFPSSRWCYRERQTGDTVHSRSTLRRPGPLLHMLTIFLFRLSSCIPTCLGTRTNEKRHVRDLLSKRKGRRVSEKVCGIVVTVRCKLESYIQKIPQSQAIYNNKTYI